MQLPRRLYGALSTWLWWLLSVPLYVKILGIGLLVTLLFGGVAFYEIRVGMLHTHYQIHGETALSLALSLSTRIQPLVNTGDAEAIDHEIDQTMEAFPAVRYIVVQDNAERIISHGFGFPEEAPADLLKREGDLCASCHPLLSPTEVPADLLEVPPTVRLPAGRPRAYRREGGLVLEVTVPVEGDQGGTVRLGVGDRMIVREMNAISRSLLWSLALCAVIGQLLALILAYILVRPIHNLVQVTNRLREADFSARAQVFSSDEVGHLAVVFNQMAEGLETYRREVQEKEAARVSLIGRIVQAQEEERKSVARELHDQLGQSLSNVLLLIESHCKDCHAKTEGCDHIKCEIRDAIDQVRRLAWDARPSILDDYGLDMALARYVEEVSKRVEFPVDFQYVAPADSVRLPDRIEITLYRIAQEAMTNTVRHAQASQASIVLLRHGQEVSLIVEDNGCGFDLSAAEKGEGAPLGLMGMEERAALVGGVLAIDTHPGKGTTVRVRILVGKDPHGDSDSGSG